MIRLAVILYILTATVFAGTGVIAVLTVHMIEPREIASAFAIGLLVALPVAWLVARNLYSSMHGPRAGR